MTRILILPSWNFAWISSDKSFYLEYLCEETTAFKSTTEINTWIEKNSLVLESLSDRIPPSSVQEE